MNAGARSLDNHTQASLPSLVCVSQGLIPHSGQDLPRNHSGFLSLITFDSPFPILFIDSIISPSSIRISDLALLSGHFSRLPDSIPLGWIPFISYVNVDHRHGKV